MAERFPTEPAVIATCPECGERSKPVDPALAADEARWPRDTLEGFERDHRGRHERESIKARGEQLGHKIKIEQTVMEPGCMEGIARCSCGWEGRETQIDAAGEQAAEHHREVVEAARGEGSGDAAFADGSEGAAA